MAQGADTSAEREMFRRQQLAAQHNPLSWWAGSLARWNPTGPDEGLDSLFRAADARQRQLAGVGPEAPNRGLATRTKERRARIREWNRLMNSNTDMRSFLVDVFTAPKSQTKIPGWVMDAWSENPDWDVSDMRRFLHDRLGEPKP